jgi:hypothetical protein
MYIINISELAERLLQSQVLLIVHGNCLLKEKNEEVRMWWSNLMLSSSKCQLEIKSILNQHIGEE